MNCKFKKAQIPMSLRTPNPSISPSLQARQQDQLSSRIDLECVEVSTIFVADILI